MKIEDILAENEEVKYIPKLHWFVYFDLFNIVKYKTTRMFVSNKRFYFCHGLVTRNAYEIVISKIETINVKETFWGRIFGYGNITFSGTGVSSLSIHKIKKPHELQRQIRSVQGE